jgi:REP element-mobilizing transposase RayT
MQVLDCCSHPTLIAVETSAYISIAAALVRRSSRRLRAKAQDRKSKREFWPETEGARYGYYAGSMIW